MYIVEGRPDRITGDFVIDGHRLQEHISTVRGKRLELVTPIGNMPDDYVKAWVTKLQGLAPTMLPSGRCELFICPECGDLACGCVSCVVSREGEYVLWSDFGWEIDYAPEELSLYMMGGFRFLAEELAGALMGYM